MFDEILATLGKYPQVRYEKRENLIRVLPSTREGFAVVIEEVFENHFSVSFDHWHEDFYNLEEAVDTFLLGLSNHSRVKVESKGGVPFRWTVEYLDDTQWRERSSNSVWTHRFLSPATTAYLQNDLLSQRELRPILARTAAHRGQLHSISRD
jgi:hypothetical protein